MKKAIPTIQIMKKAIPTIIALIFLSNCTYDYAKYGLYSDVNPEYRSKKHEDLALHYKTSSDCTYGGRSSYCSNKPMLQKIDEVFREYNMTPVVAKKYESKPTLEAYDVSGGIFLDSITQIASILTIGIVPARHKKRYEVRFTNNDYKISNKEYVTEWTGWFMIPFSSKSDKTTSSSIILDGLLRTTLNKAIKDKKIQIDVENISAEPKKLINNFRINSNQLLKENTKKANSIPEKNRIY